MDSKTQKLLNDFYFFCSSSQQYPTFQDYLKAKNMQLFGREDAESNIKINWKNQLIEAYKLIENHDSARLKITIMCEQIISSFTKIIKSKEFLLQQLSNELSLAKQLLEGEKTQISKLQKEYDQVLERQRIQIGKTLEDGFRKEQRIHELEEAIEKYQKQIQEVNSIKYQDMMKTIKEEEILNEETQKLYKENTILKYQIREQNKIINQLRIQIKLLTKEISYLQAWHDKAQSIMQQKVNVKQQNQKYSFKISKDYQQSHEKTINVIQFKDNFSFKDSMQSEYIYDTQQSPSEGLKERDILNLTNRNRSSQSRNVSQYLFRSKNLQLDKENISQNTFDYNGIEDYDSKSKNCKLGFNQNARGTATQLQNSLAVSKHRRIKSNQNIQEFHEYENNNFITKSEESNEQLLNDDKSNHQERQQDETMNLIKNLSEIFEPDVNEIVINEELIKSNKQKNYFDGMHLNSIVSESEVLDLKTNQNPLGAIYSSVDIYYAFFSLTAQCVKLNAKNFNKAISVFFDLEAQYINVVKNTIPINKWYNYINEHIEFKIKQMFQPLI